MSDAMKQVGYMVLAVLVLIIMFMTFRPLLVRVYDTAVSVIFQDSDPCANEILSGHISICEVKVGGTKIPPLDIYSINKPYLRDYYNVDKPPVIIRFDHAISTVEGDTGTDLDFPNVFINYCSFLDVTKDKPCAPEKFDWCASTSAPCELRDGGKTFVITKLPKDKGYYEMDIYTQNSGPLGSTFFSKDSKAWLPLNPATAVVKFNITG